MTTTKTGQLLSALGINKIYWIDDKFFNGQVYTEETIRKSIVDLIRNGGPLPDELSRFSPYLENALDEVILIQEVTEFIQGFEEKGQQDDIEKVYRALLKVEALNEEDALSDAGFERLESLFAQPKLTKLSFSDWVEQRDTLDSGEQALYLIDYENKIDTKAHGLSGKDVLHYLADRDVPPFSIVLTHVCQPNNETSKATEIFQGIKNNDKRSIRRFSLMSKKRIAESMDGDADGLIAPAFKRLAINQMYRRIAENCLTSMKAGLEDGINRLNDLPVEDIEHAIFARSSEEGVSEPEVINRILGISQRSSFFSGVAAAIKDPQTNYFKELRQLRDVKNISTTSDEYYQVHEVLEDLRYAELVDSGDFVNPICSPLTCGDIFQKWTDNGYNGSLYILLASPCDLMVRDDGKRNASEGVFASLKWKSIADNEPTEADQEAKKYEIAIGTSMGRLVVDFHTSTTVNLKVLDFCVSNTNGEVKYGRNMRLPNVLLTGWRRRFEDLNTICERDIERFPEQYRTLCMFDEEFSGIRNARENGKNEIHFPLQRQYRIRSPYAEAILDAYLRSVGRPAFDHSFAERR
jgi:hypothetical protein